MPLFERQGRHVRPGMATCRKPAEGAAPSSSTSSAPRSPDNELRAQSSTPQAPRDRNRGRVIPFSPLCTKQVGRQRPERANTASSKRGGGSVCTKIPGRQTIGSTINSERAYTTQKKVATKAVFCHAAGLTAGLMACLPAGSAGNLRAHRPPDAVGASRHGAALAAPAPGPDEAFGRVAGTPHPPALHAYNVPPDAPSTRIDPFARSRKRR